MIKNLLYSAFFHLILIAVIFISFTDNKIKENVIEISVSLMSEKNQKSLPKPQKEEIPENKKIEEKPQPPQPKEKPEPKKEESKPEVKKPEEPKKEIKKEEKKPEPKKEEKKPELKKEEPKKESKPEPEKIEETPKIQETPKINEDEKEIKLNVTDADLNKTLEKANLLTREKLNIQYQLMVCYKRAVDESKKESKSSVTIKVFIDKQGIIHHNLDEIIDIGKYNEKNSDYKIAIDNIKTAFIFCNPLRNLPEDKYDSWKELVLEFKNLEN